MKGIVVFTMKGCPHCAEFKNMLRKSNIPFLDYDIDENPDEYGYFISKTNNNLIPAFMLYEDDAISEKLTCYAPMRDFNLLEEGVQIIKNFI